MRRVSQGCVSPGCLSQTWPERPVQGSWTARSVGPKGTSAFCGPARTPGRAFPAGLPGGVLCLAFLFSAFPLAAGEWVHPFDVAQTKSFPEKIRAVIEIPAGSFTKYEIDKKTGYVEADRFVSMPMAYPANYGALPQTLSGDGDTLDVLVLTREPLHPGVFITVRPIGYIKLIDGGETDDKVIAVPTTKVDPTYEQIHQVADLPPIEKQRLEAFFRVYKQLPAGRKKIELKGWGSAEEARELLLKTHKRYRDGR